MNVKVAREIYHLEKEGVTYRECTLYADTSLLLNASWTLPVQEATFRNPCSRRNLPTQDPDNDS